MLYEQGLELFTKIRKNMKNKFIRLKDKIHLKRRSLIETVIELLKNWMDLWHASHKSVDNAFKNMLACLAAYSYVDEKPSFKDKTRDIVLSFNNNTTELTLNSQYKLVYCLLQIILTMKNTSYIQLFMMHQLQSITPDAVGKCIVFPIV